MILFEVGYDQSMNLYEIKHVEVLETPNRTCDMNNFK